MSLDLIKMGLVTDRLVLMIGFDIENLSDPERAKIYRGAVAKGNYGRKIPKHAHGTKNLDRRTSSTMLIVNAVLKPYERIVDPALLVRRITLAACLVENESRAQARDNAPEQRDLLTHYEAREQERRDVDRKLEKERRIQEAVLGIKKKYGKNAVLKGMNLEDGATAAQRNNQSGGHRV